MGIDEVTTLVRRKLAELNAEGSGVDFEEIGPETSLINDLGLDSLKFVDLTLALEDGLGIDEFPMQDWVDSQTEASARFTVHALVEACVRLLPQEDEPRRSSP